MCIRDSYYGGKSAVEVLESGEKVPAKVEPLPVDETTPCFRNIHVKNLVCAGARRALDVYKRQTLYFFRNFYLADGTFPHFSVTVQAGYRPHVRFRRQSYFLPWYDLFSC